MGVFKIPEYELWKTLNLFLDLTRKNFAAQTNPQNSFLWDIFGTNEHDELIEITSLKYFEQAQAIFIKEDAPRSLTVTIGYNAQQASTPTIHIILPLESPNGAGIGMNEGYEPHKVDTDRRKSYPVFTASSQVVYNLLITSDNPNEAVIIYHWLKAAMLSLNEQLALRGFQNVQFGGSDFSLDENMVPPGIFHRNFNMTFTYDWSIPNLLGRNYQTGVRTPQGGFSTS